MSTITPSGLTYGTIVGQFKTIEIDSSDPDGLPDHYPMQGTIKLNPSANYLQYVSSLGDEAVGFHKTEFTAVLDSEGFICTPGFTLTRGLVLLAADNPNLQPGGWTWKVSLSLQSFTGAPVTNIDPFDILVRGGEIVDLPRAIKVPASPGIGIPAMESVALRAENHAFSAATSASEASVAATQAQALAESMVVANDTTISLIASDPNSDFSNHLSATIGSAVDGVSSHSLTDASLSRAERAHLVTIPTYEGSGVAIHPSVVYRALGWNGYKYWMAFTPYPSQLPRHENPSIVASNDGETWVVPAGLANPVVPGSGTDAIYNSDPSLVIDSSGTMWLFWRYWNGTGEEFFYRTSTDGVTWGDRFSTGISNTGLRLLSPAATSHPDGSWTIYFIDMSVSPRVVRRMDSPVMGGAWSETLCSIVGNTTEPWHIDCHLVGGEWHLAVQDTGSGGGEIWAAISQDGVNFKAGNPLMGRYPGEWDENYYRASFVPAVSEGLAGWDMWVSGAYFPASGQIMGRTFVHFDRLTGQLAEKQDQIDSLRLTSEMPLAARGIYPWIGGDSFSRPDGASLGTADSGQAWEPSAGTFRILGKSAATTLEENTRATIDTASIDHASFVRLSSVPITPAELWLIARFQDPANYYRFGFDAEGNLVLSNVTAGEAPVLRNYFKSHGVQAAGMDLGIECSGTNIRLFCNGRLVDSLTDSSNVTGTRVGLQCVSADVRFRDFRFRE